MNIKSVLKVSPFTTALTRALKKDACRLHCQVTDDGSIYVCNGYFAVKLMRDEYDAFVRPVSQRDAGNWVLSESRELMNIQPIDVEACVVDAHKAAAYKVTAAPLLFELNRQKKNAVQLSCFYSEDGDFVSAYNIAYNSIISPTLERKSGGQISPMVVYIAENDPIAIILPIRIKDKPGISRAVRGWFTEENEAQSQKDNTVEKLRRRIEELGTAERQAAENKRFLERDNEGLRQEYAKLHTDCRELQDKIDALTAALASKDSEIAALTERLNAQPEAQAQDTADKSQPKDKAAALVKKLAALPNVTATVKGAQTAAPVVWLSGDTNAHKDAIEKLGGKWSGKRSAWYFKIS